MRPRIWGRASVSYAFGLALAFLGLAVAMLVFVIVSFWSPWPSLPDNWDIFSLYFACLSYCASGLLLWWFRPTNRLGPLLVGVGFFWLFVGLTTSSSRPVAAVGVLFGTAPIAGLLHVLLAFPSGRLRSPAARIVVTSAYVACFPLSAPLYLFLPSPLSIRNDPHLVDVVHQLQLWLVTVPGSVATVVILVGRIRRTTSNQRAVLWPLYGYGVFAVFALPFANDILRSRLDWAPLTIFAIQTYVMGLAPVFFAAAALSGVFARTGQVDELAAWLSRTRGSDRGLQRVLAETLGDDSVRLLFWLPAAEHYVDTDGVVVELPAADPARGLQEILVGGRLAGAIEYDAELIPDPGPVRAAAQVVALSVDRERLLADLRASEEALRQSRARIVEAGDRERRRVARNLHDGVQGKLVMLAIQARTIADDPATPERVRAEATDLWERIDAVTSELRQQVHAVMPAALIERDVVAAIEDLADRMPVRTTLSVGAATATLPPPVQSTAYFVVAEALTNAVKYARAESVEVRLAEQDGRLLISVVDDGVGGAALGSGTGLRGLADRAEALGGRLTVESIPGAGTRLSVELPVAATAEPDDVPAGL